MKNILNIFIALLCTIPFAHAQRIVKGTVTDVLTKEPLTGAVVVANKSKDHIVVDNAGRFVLPLAHVDDSLFVTYTGYKPLRLKISDELMHITLIPSSSDLNEVIVSANRQQQARTEAPIAISTVSKMAIEDTKATQLDQLLNRSAGVYMVDLGNQQHEMAIRQPLGTNNYYLYMEDGIPIRVEGDFNHNALIEVNDAALERIEIIKGPASSLYGSEAVGGAVNFITQAPSLTPIAKIESEIGSYGYQRVDAFASGTVGKLGLYVGGYYADRNVSADQYDNFHKLALNFRADYKFNATTNLTVTAANVDYYTDQKGGLTSAQFFNNNYVNDPISNQRFTYRKVNAFRTRATLDHNWNDHSNTSITVYYRNNSVGQNPFYYETTPIQVTPAYSQSTGQINVDAFNSYGVVAQHVQKFNWLKAKWITGVSGDISPETYNAQFININVDNGVYDTYTASDSMLVKYKANLYNFAGYTQIELAPTNKLKIIGGIRYDQLDYVFTNLLTPSATTGPADTVNHFAHVTPKVGATYNFGKDIGAYANFSMGFAPPNITDLYSGFNVPALKPATFYNYEIGGWLGINSHSYVEASIYELDGVNELVSITQPNGIPLSQNSGKTTHTGIEVSFNYNVTNDLLFRLNGTYAVHKYTVFMDGQTDVAGKMMADAPPYIVNSQLTYKPHYVKGFLLSLEWQSVAQYYTDPENLHKYDGYNIFNIRAAYHFNKVANGLEVWANCLNVTDQVYATIVTYQYGKNNYMPGVLRTFNVGVGYTFAKRNS